MDLGLSYLTMDRAAATLSTGERQRMQLARAVRNRTTGVIHTVKPLEVDIPKGRLTVVTGVFGSGKTTMVLESLIPALEAQINGARLPEHVKSVTAEGISHVKLIDATPIGINVRSTVATYANVHDELRKIYARTEDAKKWKYKAGDFSYNTGKLRCPSCDGTGEISLDVIRNADYIIDMGPGGGETGGQMVAAGTPEQIRNNSDSITGKWI